jgi:hypothetical protein
VGGNTNSLQSAFWPAFAHGTIAMVRRGAEVRMEGTEIGGAVLAAVPKAVIAQAQPGEQAECRRLGRSPCGVEARGSTSGSLVTSEVQGLFA